jgi:hypothetical protein
VLIQLAYNLHSAGQPQVLGYATSMSNDVLLNDTNDYRSKSGLPSLSLNSNLNRAAQAKAESMITGNYWSHVAPDGTTPWYYFGKEGYKYSMAGENLAYGFSTSDQVIAAWMNSPEHKDNVLGDYADVGFGFANGSDYQHGNNTVVVAMYGLPITQKPLITATGGGTTQAPLTTLGSTAGLNTNSQHVNGMSTIAGGSAPWATYASLALIGATVMGFIVTHLETVRSGWRSARKYTILHPIVDMFILTLLALVFVQASGGFIR